MPAVYDKYGNKIVAGQNITSRMGELYRFRYVSKMPTTSTFGKIVVSKVLREIGGESIAANSSLTFTDYAFSVTIR